MITPQELRKIVEESKTNVLAVFKDVLEKRLKEAASCGLLLSHRLTFKVSRGKTSKTFLTAGLIMNAIVLEVCEKGITRRYLAKGIQNHEGFYRIVGYPHGVATKRRDCWEYRSTLNEMTFLSEDPPFFGYCVYSLSNEAWCALAKKKLHSLWKILVGSDEKEKHVKVIRLNVLFLWQLIT